MKTNTIKINDAFEDVSPCLLRQAAKGRVHALLINSDKQSETLSKAFSALGMAYASTDDVQIFNAVPGFVVLRDEAAAKKLTATMRGMGCDSARMALNPNATSTKDLLRHTFVSGGRGYTSFP